MWTSAWFKSLSAAWALMVLLSLTPVSRAQDESPLLAFMSDGGATISTIHADGSELRVLTDPAVYPYVGIPYWSPDGSSIAFIIDVPDPDAGVSAEGSPFTRASLMIMNADGTDIHEIPDGDTLAPPAEKLPGSMNPSLSHVQGLAWSPDSTQIAFQWMDTEKSLLYVASADGTNAREIMPMMSSDIEWTSDSQRVIFEAWGEDSIDVFSADVVNGTIRPVAHSPESDFAFDLSPDDQHVAYMSDTPDGTQIFVVSLADAEPPVQITDGALNYRNPLWSADGMQILCMGSAAAGQDGDAYLVDPDGANLRALSSTGAVLGASWTRTGDVQLFERLPDSMRANFRWVDVAGSALPLPDIFASAIMFRFSPDRTLVAFVMDGDDGNRDIYVANPDGSNVRRLTTDRDVDNWPLWQP